MGSAQEKLGGIFTPLKLEHWESLLASHPDKEYVNYLLRGIREGFRIGFKKSGSVSSARRNVHSALENSSAYLAEEKRSGVLLGPFERSGVPEVHLNRFGVIPKSSQPGK